MTEMRPPPWVADIAMWFVIAGLGILASADIEHGSTVATVLCVVAIASWEVSRRQHRRLAAGALSLEQKVHEVNQRLIRLNLGDLPVEGCLLAGAAYRHRVESEPWA